MKKSYSAILTSLMLLIGIGGTLPVYGQVPVISRISTESAHACEVIEISGFNFESGARVFFGAVEGNVVSVSDQLIEVEVPTGAIFDHLVVINPSGRRVGYSRNKFLPSFGGNTGISAGDFGAQVDLSVNTGLFDLCLCDLNGDGTSEIITTSRGTNKIDILFNNSTPGSLSFSRREITLPGVTLNVACGDLNGDAKPDLVFTEGDDGSRIFILQNNSTMASPSFAAQTYNIPGSATKRIAIRDMDFDGRADLIVTDQSLPNVYIVKNTSGGAISFAASYGTLTIDNAKSTSGLAVDDFDGDRRPDILVTQFLESNGGFFHARNTSTQGNLSFDKFQKTNANGAFFNIVSAKINKDNRPDIAGTQFTENVMSLYANTSGTGNISFNGPTFYPSSLRPWGIDGGDLDGDGNIDFALATIGSSLSVSVMNGDGSGAFSHRPLSANFINRNIRIGDIDGDGKPDLVFTSVDDQANAIPASRVSIFLNEKCINPVIEPTGPLNLCSGYTEMLSVTCIPGATYDWKVDGVTVQNGANNEIETTQAGSYTVTVNQGGCSTTSDPVQVNITSGSSLPTASLSSNSPVCRGQTLSLSSSDVGATSYVWTGPDGFTATGRNVSIDNFAIRNAGRYYLEVYSGSCLIQSESVLVEATAAPEFSLVAPSDGQLCEGTPAPLQIIPQADGFDYQWFKDGSPISGATSATYDATSSGTYYAEITDQGNGCPKIITESVSPEFVAAPTASFDAPSGVCANSPVTFTNTSDYNGTATFTWDFGDGTTSNDVSPTHAFTAQTTYEVSLTVSYGGGCEDVITKDITVADGLTVEMNIADVTICEGETVELSPIGTYAEYTWQDGNKDPVYKVTETGTYTVVVRDAGGCEGTVSSTITVNGVPNVVVTADPPAVPPGEPVKLNVTGLMTYNWEPADVLDDPNMASPTAIIEETTVFTVTGTTDTGCQASGEIRVGVSGDLLGEILHPKNFFSPNPGDMINATWEIEGILDYPDCQVEIFDQTGSRIYQSMPYLNDWDGTSGGQMVPDGAYYYVISLDGKAVKSGSVTLLRN